MITPSFNLTATERVLPRLALDFTTETLDPRVTVTRALNTATRVNSSGLVEVVNADLPRSDYDPATLTAKGLLIEEARTNLFLQSADFSVSWVTFNASVGVDETTSPSGVADADTLIENTALSIHYVGQAAGGSGLNTYSYSVYAKNLSGNRYLQLWLGNTTSGSAYARFDLVNGTKTQDATIAGTGYAAVSASIFPAGNGWYRCVLVATKNTTGGTNTAQVRLSAISTGAESNSYQGDDTSGVYLWGAQLEAGAFPTSYIPTTTTAVTRNADVATMTGTNLSDWFNPTEGTFVAEYSCFNSVNPSKSTGVLTGDSANSRFIYLLLTGASRIYNGTDFVQSSVIPNNTLSKTAVAYSSSGMSISTNGAITTVGGSSAGDLVATASLGVGGTTGVNQPLNGHFKKLAFYNQRLTDREMQAFSKG